MSDFVTATPVRKPDLEGLINDLRETFDARWTNERPWIADVPNLYAVNGPTSGLVGTASAGNVTENRAWAFAYYSRETGRETGLSTAITASLTSEQMEMEGPRSTDRSIDRVRLYTRLNGAGATAWRMVTELDNPTAGNWEHTDNSAYSAYLGNRPPLYFEHLLQTVCGKGYTMRRVKVTAVTGSLEASSSAYWIIRLEVRANARTLPRYTREQDTTKVGIQPQNLYNIPLFHQLTDTPTRDLALALNEDERVYLTLRGVGAVSVLPQLRAMVDVTREVS